MSALITLIFGNYRTTLIGLVGAITTAAVAYLSGQGGIYSAIASAVPLIIGALTKHGDAPAK